MNEALLQYNDNNPLLHWQKQGHRAVLSTLAYFDIFQYPLQKAEIRRFMGLTCTENALSGWLDELLKEGKIFQQGDCFQLRNDPSLFDRRCKGNKAAEVLLQKASRIGRFLYRFPFVRAIGISGSLSKDFADEHSDIDFFIITAANRLWIARTLMHLFKKLTFLTGKQHYYCMNYYLDEEALALEEQNIFTAIEIKTLLPVCGNKVMHDFFRSNNWSDEYLPAGSFREQAKADPPASLLKKMTEWFLKGRAGNLLEQWLMQLTRKRWNKKEEEGKQNQKGITMGLISGKHFARSNPGKLQEKILTAYRQRLQEIEKTGAAPAALLFPL